MYTYTLCVLCTIAYEQVSLLVSRSLVLPRTYGPQAHAYRHNLQSTCQRTGNEYSLDFRYINVRWSQLWVECSNQITYDPKQTNEREANGDCNTIMLIDKQNQYNKRKKNKMNKIWNWTLHTIFRALCVFCALVRVCVCVVTTNIFVDVIWCFTLPTFACISFAIKAQAQIYKDKRTNTSSTITAMWPMLLL